MRVRYNPFIVEIADGDIEVFRSGKTSDNIYVIFRWAYEGERYGKPFTINGSKYDPLQYYTSAYKIADEAAIMFSNFLARTFSLDDNNHVGRLTKDLVATKIINLYKGASENG